MNLALGALLLFLLLFPGILFQIGYFNGPYSRKNIQSSLIDELLQSLGYALFLQGIGYLIATHWSGYTIRLEQIYQLVIGASQPLYHPDFQLIERSIGPFLAYNLGLFSASLVLGYSVRRVVELLEWDIRFHGLRFNNDWYYLLSGHNKPGLVGKIEYIMVDTLVETKEGSYIYCGVLKEFFLSKDGLDRICLTEVSRRKLINDQPQTDKPSSRDADERYYQMPGDMFVIPYSQMKNINLSYYRLILEPPSVTPPLLTELPAQ